MEGKPLTIYGDGKQARDYVFADDVALGLIAVALSPQTNGRVFNLGSGVGTPFREMVKKIADCIPQTEIREVPWPPDRYFVETGDYVTDLSNVKAATAWCPRVNLDDGIQRTIAFYRENRHQYWETETLAFKA
jgi:nucleoside-diphosphate-sugar epimerase